MWCEKSVIKSCLREGLTFEEIVGRQETWREFDNNMEPPILNMGEPLFLYFDLPSVKNTQ